MAFNDILSLAADLRQQAEATNLFPYHDMLNHAADALEAEAKRLLLEVSAVSGGGELCWVGETTYSETAPPPPSLSADRPTPESVR